jgi:DNA-binding transcriptional MerR regulator
MSDHADDLMAIPRLADRVGVSPRVLRYWEELGIISPSVEHGRLRYAPRDEAIARLVKRLLEVTDCGIDGIRMLKRTAERSVLAGAGDEAVLLEEALRLLYARKAFRRVTGVDEERFAGPPPPPPPHPPHPGHRERQDEAGHPRSADEVLSAPPHSPRRGHRKAPGGKPPPERRR